MRWPETVSERISKTPNRTMQRTKLLYTCCQSVLDGKDAILAKSDLLVRLLRHAANAAAHSVQARPPLGSMCKRTRS